MRQRSLPSGGRRLARLLIVAAAWLAAATLGWICLLMLELALASATSELPSEMLAWNATLALKYSTLCSIPLLCAHLLRHALARRLTSRRATVVTLLAVLVAAAFIAWPVATLLTSGDGIVDHPFRAEIRALLFVVASLCWPLLWLWHLAVALPGSITIHPRSTRNRVLVEITAVSIGIVVLAGIVFAASGPLDSYSFLAAHLLPAAWLLVATLAYRILRPAWHPLMPLVFVAILGSRLTSLGQHAPDHVKWLWHTHHRLAGMTDEVLDPLTHTSSVVGFDVSGLDARACTQTDATASVLPESEPPRGIENIILISIDTLRPDAVSWVVDGRSVAPHLRAFRDESVDFRRAVSTYPATVFALGGALTGLGPSELLMSPSFPENVFRTVQPVFDRQFSILPAHPWFATPVVNALYVQGTPVERIHGADFQSARFIEQLAMARRAGERTLAWLHFLEPHYPYELHAGFVFGDDDEASRYASEIAYVDDQLGRVLGYLRDDGWFEDSLVIVFSDHGEALGERGYKGHHVYLNGWMIDIALYARWPGHRAMITDALVDIRDIHATVLHVAPSPCGQRSSTRSLIVSAQQGGKSMVVAEAFPIRGDELMELAASVIRTDEELAERIELVQRSAPTYEPKVALVTEDFRFIVHRNTGVRELYARGTDPGEEENLVFAHDSLARELDASLSAWYRERSREIYCALTQGEKQEACHP